MVGNVLKRIDKKSQVPMYFQIYSEIKRAIEEERLIAGETLYPESKLQQIFAVSRVTVRKALEELEREGFIERIAGRGTIIQDYRNAFHWSRLTSFSNDLRKVEKVTSIILNFNEQRVNKKIARLLEINENETVYYLERIRLINDQKVSLARSYLSPRIPIKLTASMFDEQTSLFALLSSAGLEIGNCDETIEARIPTPEVRELLEMDNESAIFYKERITYDAGDRPFEFIQLYYNSYYYRYYIKNGPAFRERYGKKT